MEEMDYTVPRKVLECMEKDHHLIELKEGSKWFYACKDCHYVVEAQCRDVQPALVSQ